MNGALSLIGFALSGCGGGLLGGAIVRAAMRVNQRRFDKFDRESLFVSCVLSLVMVTAGIACVVVAAEGGAS